MAEINEPTKITNYLTLVGVDAAVTFVSVSLTYKVSVYRLVFQCFFSKLFFAAALAIFYDDRILYIL